LVQGLTKLAEIRIDHLIIKMAAAVQRYAAAVVVPEWAGAEPLSYRQACSGDKVRPQIGYPHMSRQGSVVRCLRQKSSHGFLRRSHNFHDQICLIPELLLHCLCLLLICFPYRGGVVVVIGRLRSAGAYIAVLVASSTRPARPTST